MSKGDLGLVDNVGAMQLAIQAAISEAYFEVDRESLSFHSHNSRLFKLQRSLDFSLQPNQSISVTN